MVELKCPECSSVLVLLGEGGYGECSNDECRLKVKTDQCNIPDCDELALEKEKKSKYEMKD